MTRVGGGLVSRHIHSLRKIAVMFSRRLWSQGPFVRFVLGATLSVMGTWFNTVAVAVLTYHLTGQVSSTATAILVSVLPRVFLSPIGGVLADHFERRTLLVALDLGSALVALSPLLVHDRNVLPLLYAAVFLLQVASSLYRPAQNAYLTHLVPEDMLGPASATFSTLSDAAMFAGPALAAGVLGVWGPGIGFLGNALSFLVSALALLTLPRVASERAEAVSIRTILAGYAGISRRYPLLSALYLVGFATCVPIYYFQSAIVAFAASLGQPSSFAGMLYAAAGAGGVIGGMVMSQVQHRLKPLVAMIICMLDIPLVGLLSVIHQPVVALAFLLVSVSVGIVSDVVFTVHVGRYVPAEERGRAFALLYWTFSLGQLSGAVLGIVVPGTRAVSSLLWISIAMLPLALAGLGFFVHATRTRETNEQMAFVRT